MTPRVRSLVIWAPRLIGLAVTGFVALFALDAFDGRPIVDVLPDFGIHLIPAALVGLAVAVGWRFPWAGTAGLGGLAMAYAALVLQRPDWILVISGPLALTAALYALSGLLGRYEPSSQGGGPGVRS